MCHQGAEPREKLGLTWRRTPIPAKIAFAGGNTCDGARQRVALKQLNVPSLTTPTPLPRVVENAYKTFTVGSSHLVHSSSVL